MKGFWSVPRLWAGETVVILASGSSMNERVAREVYNSGLPSIAINNTFKLAPFASMIYAADKEWWLHPSNAEVFSLTGMLVSVSQVNDKVLRLRNTGKNGYDPEPHSVRTGGNSGYQALHIAISAGAKRVLLVGYNMGGPHWHGRHLPGLRESPQEHYGRFRQSFDTIVKPAADLGVEVLNCTPGTALKAFPLRCLEDELCRAH